MTRLDLEAHLRAVRDSGRKILVPYVVAGMSADWLDTLRFIAASGADAVEVGIPFSDPMIDGPVIQQAAKTALERNTTPTSVLGELADADLGIPVVVMTYYNLIFRAGERRFARELSEASVSGAIVVDLPLDEAGEWCAEADDASVSTVLLVAPTTPVERAKRICERSRGFVYAISTMGVTGERTELAATATDVASRLTRITDLPVCIGIGVSSGEQAAEVSQKADGVVVGSALVRRLIDGCGPEGAGAFVAELRQAIDQAR